MNEYAFVLDKSKGNVYVYVGATKTSLSDTDIPVVFGENDKNFYEVSSLKLAKRRFLRNLYSGNSN